MKSGSNGCTLGQEDTDSIRSQIWSRAHFLCVCTDDIAEVHLGGSAGSIAKSAAFVWKTCLPNVALLVKPAAPLRGERSQRKSRRGCFTQQVLEMRMFQPRPRQHEAFWARLAGTKSRELSGDNPPPPNPPYFKRTRLCSVWEAFSSRSSNPQRCSITSFLATGIVFIALLPSTPSDATLTLMTTE